MTLGAVIGLLAAVALALVALVWLVAHNLRSPERSKDRRP